MSEVENKKSQPNNKSGKAPQKKSENSEMLEKLDELAAKYDQLHDDLELCISVNRIVIELLGGISPGRKNLDSVQIVKLRNEGVKVKDLARMQGISECAMHRKLKELREEGLLSV